MERRQFLEMGAKSIVAAATVGLIGCRNEPEISVNMATSWPTRWNENAGKTVLFSEAQFFAHKVAELTNGKLNITPLPVNQNGIRFNQVLDTVQNGGVPMGHTAGYYGTHKGMGTAFCAMPFGMTADDQNKWLYEEGGLELMQAYYAERFNTLTLPVGNTGSQMGGWFQKELKNSDQFQNLVMRLPGLGGRVLSQMGATVLLLPGSEIYGALKSGAISAGEFVAPYDDMQMNLHDAIDPNVGAYHFPSVGEPSLSIDLNINLDWWATLPHAYQTAIEEAARIANDHMFAEYDAKNSEALTRVRTAGFEPKPFSYEILNMMQDASTRLYDQLRLEDPDGFGRIFSHWDQFRQKAHQKRYVPDETASDYRKLCESYYKKYVMQEA